MAEQRPKRRRAAPPDIALWHETTREVVPLRGRGSAPPAVPKPAVPPARPAAAVPAAALPPLGRLAGIDRASAERLKRGLRPIEARLDLHGMTQVEAHQALAKFVAASHRAGRRCVLVITGRGLGNDGGGVLQRAVPRWLEETELRRHLLAIGTAQPRHGGAGALYLLLKRNREHPLPTDKSHA
jgi:DNA-nicking Smr family endonuclease